ncbi:hypothetical protein TWF481_004551 [Arthrobotrys musiformis]|uniref:Transmembrane protein n=1 Tax=Arthrobotrys musiformis TaxID=47236 RepID=A0AAV9WLZ2_9PEZI
MSNEPRSENITIATEAPPYLQSSKEEQEKQNPNFDSKENPTTEPVLFSRSALEAIEQDGRDVEAQQQKEEEEQPEEDVQPERRRDRACKCICIILLLFIILAALTGGLTAYGAMGCFKKENKGKRKCRGKGAYKSSATTFVSVRGSWSTYILAFAFEVMLFLMF